MLELEKTIVEADMTALETFSRDTQVIMHKAIYLEWVKWGWKGSNEQTAVQKVMDFAAAKLAWRAEFEKTQLPAYGYITAAAVTKMLTDSVKVGDVTIQPKDLWWRGRP